MADSDDERRKVNWAVFNGFLPKLWCFKASKWPFIFLMFLWNILVKEWHLASSNLVSEVEMCYLRRDHISLSLDTSETFDCFAQYLHLGYQLIILCLLVLAKSLKVSLWKAGGLILDFSNCAAKSRLLPPPLNCTVRVCVSTWANNVINLVLIQAVLKQNSKQIFKQSRDILAMFVSCSIILFLQQRI